MTVYSTKYRGSRKYLLVFCKLITAARGRSTVSYQQVAKIMGLPSSGNYMQREVGQMLGEISQDEHEHRRPMLTSIAVNTRGFPGSGLYVLARELGKLKDSTPEGERRFWEAEKAAVYATWQTDLQERET